MTCFTYHTLNATDPVRANTFYRDLFGWVIDDKGRCSIDGLEVATITLSKAPPHVPSNWLPFLGVENVDAATEQARKLGAQVRRHTSGNEAVIVDPWGAAVGLRNGGAPAKVFAWDELLTNDPNAAANFYAELGGLEIESIDLGPAGMYQILCAGGTRIAGVMKHPANLHPHWQPYIRVTDVDVTMARAIELGAELYFEPINQAGFGRWSAIDDPVGAGVCFLHPA
jgi:predicted enzyme related to lactoylglutathione lyase